jgi:hypothetical protein
MRNVSAQSLVRLLSLNKMMKSLLVIIVMCGFGGVVSAQPQRTRPAKALVDANKPAVFLSFLRLTRIEPDDPTDDPNYLFFRLTNNSRWQIFVYMSGVSKKAYGEASLYYAIEDRSKGTARIGSTQCHVCSFNPLAPGESIVFSLPLRHASRDTRMRIAYSFDWERENESEGGSYSEHSVVFYFRHLPPSVLPTTPPSNNSFNRTRN